MSNTGLQFRVNTDSTTSSGLGISYDTVDSNITFGYGYPRIQLRQYTLGEHMDLCNNGIDICGNNARVILTSDGLDICGTTHVSLAALSTLEGLSGKISDNFVDVTGPQDIAGTKTFTDEIQGSIESVRDGVYTRAENQDISGTKTFTEGLKCRDISLTDLDAIVGESVSYAANVSFVTDYVDSVINDINELKPATSEKIGGVILPSGENIDDISINEFGILSLPNVFFKDITNKSEVSSQTISGETFFTNAIRADICGNAGSVTDGVYLSDNQEITGSKLFSNTLRKNAELNVILVNPVEIDISSNHYHDTENPDNSYNLFKINGHEQPVLEFTYGNKYRFIQDISFSLATPLQFYVDPQLTEEYYYTTISTRDISVATPPTHVTIDIDLSTAYDGDIPAYLYYDCSENNTRTAGNKIIIKGAPGIVDTLTTQTIIGDKTFGGNVNFTGMAISTNNVSFLGGTNINATDSSFNLEENNVYVTTQTPDNSSNLAASTGFVKTNIELLKDAVGTNLDTLKELADAIGNDADFFRTIDNSFQTIIGTNPAWTVSDPSTITLLSAAIYNDNDFGLHIDASINTKVSLTGDELISGEKTFSTGIDISNLKIINPDTEFKPASAGRVLMYNSNGKIDLCGNTIITPHERIEFTGVSNEAVRTSGVQTIDGVKIFTETIDGDISGALRAPTTIMGGHLIPDTHEQYDIGSAGNKIRHIFISDNSLWIGEDHKINISEGKVRFKKRDVDKPPPTLKTYDNDIESSILTYTGKALIADISASGWLEYARSLPNLTINNNTGKEIELSDLYGNTEQDAWEDDDQTLTKRDKEAFIDVSNNAIRITNIDQTIEGNKSFSGTVDISNLKISDFSAKRNHVLMINDNYELDISADVNSAFLLDSHGVGTTHHVGIGSESDANAMLFVNGTASITDISTDTINIVGIATADGCPDDATDNTTNIATTHFVQNVSGGIYANIAVMSANIDLSFGQAKDRTDVSFGKVDVSFVKVDASFVKVATTFSQLNTDIATRSGAVDVSFVKVDASFVKVDASFDVIATTFSQLNGDIATRSGAVDVSFVKVDASFVKVDASFDIVDASLEEMVTTQNKDQTIEGKKTFLDGLTVNPDSNNPIVFDNPAGHLKVNFKCQDNASKYTKLILGHEAATTGWLHLGSDTQRGAGIIYNQTVATPFETGKFIFYTQGGDGSIFKHMQFDNEVDNSNVEFFGDVSLNDPNGKFLGDLEGNADTASLAAQATKLAATQNIAGQPFDGTLAISIDLNDLSNVNTTSPPTDGQALIWDSSQWIAGNPTEAMYANLATQATQLTTAHNIAGQPFDGTQNVVIELDDLSGVDISMNILTNGQALVWNDSSGVWNPGNVAAAGGGGGGGGGIWSLESNNIQLPNSITKVQMHDQEFVFSGSQRLLIDQRTDTSYSDVLIPASSAVWTIADDSMKLPTDISVVHINDVNFKMTGTAARFTIDLTDTPEYTVGPSQSIGWDVSGGHIIYNGEGNIGIGTKDPQSALDVSGDIIVRNGSGAKITLQSDEINFSSSGTIDGSQILMNPAASATAGKVGIGTNDFSTPTITHVNSASTVGNTKDKLHVKGNIRVSNAALSAFMQIGGPWNQAGVIDTYNTPMMLNPYSRQNIRLCENGGYVGIGTTNPDYPLHITTGGASANQGGNPSRHLNHTSTEYNNGTYSVQTSLFCAYSATVQSLFILSDNRIKSDISDIDDDRALQQVNALESKEYHYIDPHRRREMKTIGFIAQEVKEIIPNAVSLQKDWVPDEMRILSSLEWDSNVLTIADLDMSSENLTGRFKFFVSNDPSGNDEIKVEIECEKDLSGNKTNQFKFEQQYTNVFFYGKEVNDFHTIDKAQIFALHHSAIQELSRRNDTLVAENTTKTAEIAMLTADNVQLKADISLIKQHLGI